MGGDFKFHFKGRNVLTASADGVLEAIDEEIVAILVGPEGITGVKPAISPGDGGRLRCLVVAVVHGPRRVGADDQFPDLTLRDLAVIIVDETDFHACARLAARCGNTWIRLGH